MKPWKNRRISDTVRDRILQRRKIEERSIAETIWQHTQPTNDGERLADYLHYREYEVQRRKLEKRGKTGFLYMDNNMGVRQDDHIVARIIAGILWPRHYNQGRYPSNDASAHQDRLAREAVSALIHRIRRSKQFAYIGIISDWLHENPDTQDRDNIVFIGRTEKRTKQREKLQTLPNNDPRRQWFERRQRQRNSHALTTQMTIDNFLRSESEIVALQRAEEDRRRRRRQGP